MGCLTNIILNYITNQSTTVKKLKNFSSSKKVIYSPPHTGKEIKKIFMILIFKSILVKETSKTLLSLLT